jgi:hypothetical protein
MFATDYTHKFFLTNKRLQEQAVIPTGSTPKKAFTATSAAH